jgi:large subunit ribosomal protein L3
MSTTTTLRKGILGRKVGMTQIFSDNGDAMAVTVVQAGPCYTVARRSPDKDGYTAVQLGFGDARKIGEQNIADTTRPANGYFAKRSVWPQRYVREVRVSEKDAEQYEVGKPIDLTQLLKKGDFVDVEGVSKGKGYQGVMKRHHMPGFRATHGTHEFFRHGGSIGCRLTPGRVHKGKRMSGHMGDVRRTVQNLVVMEIDAAQNLVLLRGAVPGSVGGYIVVRGAKKRYGQTWKPRQEVQEVQPKNPMKASKAGAGAAKPAAGGKK